MFFLCLHFDVFDVAFILQFVNVNLSSVNLISEFILEYAISMLWSDGRSMVCFAKKKKTRFPERTRAIEREREREREREKKDSSL